MFGGGKGGESAEGRAISPQQSVCVAKLSATQDAFEFVNNVDHLDATDVTNEFNGYEFVDNTAATAASSSSATENVFACIGIQFGIVEQVFDFKVHVSISES